MADEGGLPGLPSTVDLGGAGAPTEGDPLELMQKSAREAIKFINHNPLPNEAEKLLFKKGILKKLKAYIDKFKEIDQKIADQKAEEEASAPDEETPEEEKDPFADIFGEDEAQTDEGTKEKMDMAGKFISFVKLYKEQYLKKVRLKREKQQQVKDEEKMEDILGQLKQI